MCQGAVKVRECVCAFWEVYGGWLVAENGPVYIRCVFKDG